MAQLGGFILLIGHVYHTFMEFRMRKLLASAAGVMRCLYVLHATYVFGIPGVGIMLLMLYAINNKLE